MRSPREVLDESVDALCVALRDHARVVTAYSDEPVLVIQAGEAVAIAVREHERALMAVSGWSSPLRYLGPVQAFLPAPDREEHEFAAGERVIVTERYEISVSSISDFVSFVQARFADDSVEELQGAVKILAESESWDPGRTAGAYLRTVSAKCDVSYAENGSD